MLENPDLDLVIRGEAEETMAELCKRLRSGESWDDLLGITWRNQKGEAVRNPDRPPIGDLDSIPFPAWHLFPVEKYHWAGIKLLAISSSRGCPYKCPFCITWKIHQGARRRDPAKIVEEMVWAKRNFDHDTFFFQDDSSFINRKQLEGFLDELEKSGEKLYWYYESREDTFLQYQDLWERMKKNGLIKIVFGLESPDPRLRKQFGKEGYDLPLVESMMLQLEKEFDIMVSVYLVFGLPDDTEESLNAILDYSRYLYPDRCSFVVGSLAVPFPGTDMYIELKEKDLIRNFNWDDYGFGQSVIKTSLDPEKLQEAFSQFWVGLYVRPKAILKQFKLIFSRNRFRRAMARQYIIMAVEMIYRCKKDEGRII